MVKSALMVFLAGSSNQAPTDERRFAQLTNMMSTINPNLKAAIHFMYGCNCFFMSDRSMSDPGYGVPVDNLDGACKEYRNCVWCAAKQFGDACKPEFIAYSEAAIDSNNNIQCTDGVNTCERSLCECDKLLANRHNEEFHHYNADHVWAFDFDANTECRRPAGNPNHQGGPGPHTTPPTQTGGGSVDTLSHWSQNPDPVYPSDNHVCCSNADQTSPFVMYLEKAKNCCADGSVQIGECS